ncbi:hypothetical protein HanIR_Chr06g0294121 [Helianthus annuus]|nr:hypothetical protein HanIR_Chr06g0294121 [Helianthus annuus]
MGIKTYTDALVSRISIDLLRSLSCLLIHTVQITRSTLLLLLLLFNIELIIVFVPVLC